MLLIKFGRMESSNQPIGFRIAYHVKSIVDSACYFQTSIFSAFAEGMIKDEPSSLHHANDSSI